MGLRHDSSSLSSMTWSPLSEYHKSCLSPKEIKECKEITVKRLHKRKATASATASPDAWNVISPRISCIYSSCEYGEKRCHLGNR